MNRLGHTVEHAAGDAPEDDNGEVGGAPEVKDAATAQMYLFDAIEFSPSGVAGCAAFLASLNPGEVGLGLRHLARRAPEKVAEVLRSAGIDPGPPASPSAQPAPRARQTVPAGPRPLREDERAVVDLAVARGRISGLDVRNALRRARGREVSQATAWRVAERLCDAKVTGAPLYAGVSRRGTPNVYTPREGYVESPRKRRSA